MLFRKILELILLKDFVRVMNFFAVRYGLRLAHLQKFTSPLATVQFLHSLDVKSAFALRASARPRRSFSEGGPCAPARELSYAEKIRIPLTKSLSAAPNFTITIRKR